MAPDQTPPSLRPQASRNSSALTFLLSAAYVVLAVGLVRLTVRLVPAFDAPLFASLVSVLLLAGGLLAIASLRVPGLRPMSAIGLVRRTSAGREAGIGAAIGWAAGVLLVLPGLLTLHMQSTWLLDGFHLGATAVSTLLLLLYVLGRQLVLCGLPFRSLSQATSPLLASLAFAMISALLVFTTEGGDLAQAIVAGMLQLVLCAAAARTRAIWVGTALQFFWGWSVTVLFGLPSFLWPQALGAVRTTMAGPRWATGGPYGPEAALWAGVVVLLALLALWRLTRDYAWHYTFDPIAAAGYSVDIAPPAEHDRMEQQASARPAPLVQIGGMQPASEPESPGPARHP